MNIIVTGASRGIGRETVKQLIQSGNHSVLAIARNRDKLDSLMSESLQINSKAKLTALAVDLGQSPGFDMIIQDILGVFSGIDILINNAGVLINKPLSEFTDDDFNVLMDLNFGQAFRLVRGLYKHFNPGSHIVNIGSMGGYQGSSKFPGLSLYSAAKGALAIFSECLAEEFKEDGVKVNCLALGAAQTEMLAAAFPGYTAPLTAGQMGAFVADFALHGHQYFNGKNIAGLIVDAVIFLSFWSYNFCFSR